MANSDSGGGGTGSVAMVAIVILVVLAVLAGGYMMFGRGGGLGAPAHTITGTIQTPAGPISGSGSAN